MVNAEKMDGTVQALACLAQDYEAIFNVDFDTDECENIDIKDSFEARLSENDPLWEDRNYAERMGVMATVMLHPDDLKKFLGDTAKNRVLKELEERGSYVVDFRMRFGNTVLNYRTRYVRNVFKGRNNVIVGIRNRTAEAKAEMAKQTAEKLPEAPEKTKNIAEQKTDDSLHKLTADQTMDAFISSMSHGVRTPLNAVLGYASMIERYADDPEKVKDCVRKITVSGKAMLNIVNDVIDMSGLERGLIQFEEVPGDILARAKTTGATIREEAKLKGIEYSDDFSGIRHPLIYADFRRMHQIIVNLLDNAVKYTNAGGKVRYTIEEMPCDREDYSLYKLTVSDTGVGMNEEFVKHIFNSFEYEKQDKLNVVQGTGIGMAVTKKLVEMMGGNIEVQSQPGIGTTVTVLVVHKIRTEENIAEEKDNTVLYGRRILLAEDNALNREVAREILENEHMLVEEAVDGAVAVDMVYNSEPGYYDAILMDVQMPYMDGYSATKEIRSLENKQLAGIPIFAVTANAFEEDKKRALECGMNEHLDKPVNVDKLISVLKKYIG